MLPARFYILLFAVLGFFIMPAVAQNDSSAMDIRRFDRGELNDFQNAREFRYPQNREDVKSLSDYIQQLLQKLFEQFGAHSPEESTLALAGKIMLGLFILIFAGLLVWFLTRAKLGWLFNKKPVKVKRPEYEIIEEDIHAIEYMDEIQKAVAAGNYRKAVRLQYLRTLKLLADNHLIRWSIERTNSDFRNMMRARPDYKPFDHLATSYEFVWYGTHDITEEEYRELASDFANFNASYKEKEVEA